MQKDLFNCRDLGGLETHCDRRVRHGYLLRSGNLGDVTEAGADFLVNEKNVGTYVDFRTDDEIKKFGRPQPLIDRGVDWVNLHIDTDDKIFGSLLRPLPEDWLGLYVRLFENNVGEWMRFIKTVKDAPRAVIYGCLFGKDRTGIATSLLLHQLNVKDDHILRDYSRSTDGMRPHVMRLKAIWEGTPLTLEEQFKYFLSTPEEIIEGFLLHFRSKAATDLKHIIDEIGGAYRTELQNKLLEA
jgi:protein-tyrosine phosphatase